MKLCNIQGSKRVRQSDNEQIEEHQAAQLLAAVTRMKKRTREIASTTSSPSSHITAVQLRQSFATMQRVLNEAVASHRKRVSMVSNARQTNEAAIKAKAESVQRGADLHLNVKTSKAALEVAQQAWEHAKLVHENNVTAAQVHQLRDAEIDVEFASMKDRMSLLERDAAH